MFPRAVRRTSVPRLRNALPPCGPRRHKSSVETASTLPKINQAHGAEESLREINELVRTVRNGVKAVKMPTRLAPVRTWAEEHRRKTGKGGIQFDRDESELTAAVKRFEETQLTAKPMSASLVELTLNFSKDPELTERYIATSGAIRLGKIFEDLDTLAGAAAYQHALGHLPVKQDQGSPIFVVTASVDRLDLVKPLAITSDYRLTGSVIYVGSSSMEILVAIEELSADGSPSDVCLTGRFTMAARNAATLKSQRIAPLKLSTEAERRLFEIGEEHKTRKMESSAASLEKVPPTKEEALLLHRTFLKDRAKLVQGETGMSVGGATLSEGAPSQQTDEKEELVTIASTMHSSTIHMHPQQANVHLKVFGGVLMRHCYELGWITAAIFANQPVEFLSLDALSFHSPVPIGALLTTTSWVTYTTPPDEGQDVIAAVNVLAEVIDIETGKRKRSNTFHFSFSIGKSRRRVSPLTYADAIEWLESRRRVDFADQLRDVYRESLGPAPLQSN